MTPKDIRKGLEVCAERSELPCESGQSTGCPYEDSIIDCRDRMLGDIDRALHELEQLQRFKAYWDGLYGQGLQIANWHQNGELEPFDNFYESAEQEQEEARDGENRPH